MKPWSCRLGRKCPPSQKLGGENIRSGTAPPQTIPSGAKDAFVLLMAAAPCDLFLVLWHRV